MIFLIIFDVRLIWKLEWDFGTKSLLFMVCNIYILFFFFSFIFFLLFFSKNLILFQNR